MKEIEREKKHFSLIREFAFEFEFICLCVEIGCEWHICIETQAFMWFVRTCVWNLVDVDLDE